MHGPQASKHEMNLFCFLIFARCRAPWVGWEVPIPGEPCWAGMRDDVDRGGQGVMCRVLRVLLELSLKCQEVSTFPKLSKL